MEYLFLSYAREDRGIVGNVYKALRDAALNPWMDAPPAPWQAEGIPLGAEWDPYLRDKIQRAKFVLIFLSEASIAKTGYVQREYRYALECMESRPPGQSFLLPIRLDDCKVPNITVGTIRLHNYEWHDLFILGVDGLIASILTLEGRPKSDTKLDAAVASSTRIVIENERRRVNEYLGEFVGNRDREISRLREELAYANSRIPPAEIFGDPGYMEWWLAHRFDDDISE